MLATVWSVQLWLHSMAEIKWSSMPADDFTTQSCSQSAFVAVTQYALNAVQLKTVTRPLSDGNANMLAI